MGAAAVSAYTYHRLPLKLIRVDDQIKAADGVSWLDPVTKVDTLSRPWWTRVWWSTKPGEGTVSSPDLERPNDQTFQVRRPKPNHDVSMAQVADEFRRHGCKVTEGPDSMRAERPRHRHHPSALLYFWRDTGTFAGAYLGSQWVRSLDVVRRHLHVPTHR